MKKYLSLLLIFLIQKANSQNPGDNIFNTDQLIHEVKITFPINGWYDTLTRYYTLTSQTDSSIYLMATTIEFDGVIYDSVGCKFKGNSSYNNPSQKKSWKLDFEEFKNNNEIDNMKQLNLNNGFKDPSMLREKMCLDFMEDYGIPAPRCDYANVYVNGSLWGFYMLVEEIDKTFCKARFGDKKGNLFKGDPHGDLRWKGALASQYYTDYELHTNEISNDWSDLIWLIDNINNSPANEYNDSLDASFNTSSYIKSWATTILFSNLDSYTGSGHNYYVYHNIDSNRFEWINWDVNEAFGTFLNGNQLTGMTTLPMNYIPALESRPLNSKMVGNTTYYNEYQNFICNAINDYFNPTHMNLVIDSLHNRIKTYYYNDPKKLFPTNQFDANINSTQGGSLGLKPFVQERYNCLTQQLSSFNCTPLVSSIEEAREEQFKVFPNPVSDVLQITGYKSNAKISVYDLSGRKILQTKLNSVGYELSTAKWERGLYFIRVGNRTEKMVKL